MEWYPSSERISELESEMERLKEVGAGMVERPAELMPLVSATLAAARNTQGFPLDQLRQWVWLASQLRSNSATSDKVASAASGALLFLSRKIENGIAPAELQDLRWVLGSACEEIVEEVGAGSLRNFLEPDEREKVETELIDLLNHTECDLDELKASVSSQLKEIYALANSSFLATLTHKIDVLFKFADDTNEEKSSAARAALQYLARIDDVISDESGFVGLLDDVYAVEWAYSVVSGETEWLPVMEDLIADWPFIDQVVFHSDEGIFRLDRYVRFILGATLSALFGEGRDTALVIRETGPIAILAAFFSAFQSNRDAAEGNVDPQDLLRNGQHVHLGDETGDFQAIFGGAVDGFPGKFWLIVRDRGKITIDEDILAIMRPAAKEHSRLSKGSDLSSWIKYRHPTPFTHIVGGGGGLVARQTGVLLLTRKNTLDRFLDDIRPMGSSIQRAVGLRYIASTGRESDLEKAATGRPLIYATSDADIAMDFLRDPPAHISSWVVVTEGSLQGSNLYFAARSYPETKNIPMCIFAELHERERSTELIKEGVSPWYIEDIDVEVIGSENGDGGRVSGSFRRFLSRQGTHWTVTSNTQVVENEALEELERALHEYRDNGGDDPSDPVEPLILGAATFFKKVIGYPVLLDDNLSKDLNEEAERMRGSAAAMSTYSSQAEDLGKILQRFSSVERWFPDRENLIRKVVQSEGCIESKSVAVVCRSKHIAERCDEKFFADPLLGDVRWMTMDGLRESAPFEHIIVPGWLNRIAMREIANSSYPANLHYIFLRFEKRWFDATVTAGLRFERRLSAGNAERYQIYLKKRESEDSGIPSIWSRFRQADDGGVERKVGQEPISEDGAIYENLEARIIESIKTGASNITSEKRDLAEAKLVLFEEIGAYAFLPPRGRVIGLSALANRSGRTADDEQQQEIAKRAENILFVLVRNLTPGTLVAFPVGGNRDLVDARADEFLVDAAEVRRLAGLWKDAIAEHLNEAAGNVITFIKSLEEEGEKREASTVFSWAYGTHTVAPRNFRRVVPLIARLTSHAELLDKEAIVLSSIDLIYQARSAAAKAIVMEIFSGDIDLEGEFIDFEIGGVPIRYELHRVRSIEQTTRVPFDELGKVQRFGPGGLLGSRQGPGGSLDQNGA